jgi:phosphate/sulfate permease
LQIQYLCLANDGGFISSSFMAQLQPLWAPVSTTHSIVGAIIGAGVASSGMAIVDWAKMGQIAASWVISPVLGGVVAAAMLYFIKRSIIYQSRYGGCCA